MNIFCEFIPQVIFLMSIFGYMNLLIIAKWIVFDSKSSGSAPSILITLINMFMQKYDDPNDPTVPENLKPMYPGQKTVQTILVLLAILCIPWMLVIKPWILKKENDRKVRFATFVSSPPRLEQGVVGGRRDEGDEGTERRNGSLAISQHLKIDSSQEDHRGAGVILQVEESEKGEGKNHHDDEKEEEGEGGNHGGKFELGDVIIHQVCKCTFPHFLPRPLFHPSFTLFLLSLFSFLTFFPFLFHSSYTFPSQFSSSSLTSHTIIPHSLTHSLE